MTEDFSAEDQLTVTFWGVRGSIACGRPEFGRYGGDTACLEVRAGSRLLIFDAGTGLRGLGAKLNQKGPLPRGGWDASILLSHTHFDHICGLPFFAPLFCQNSRWRIWSGHQQRLSTEQALTNLMMSPLFPIPKEALTATIVWGDFLAGDTLRPCDGVTLRTHPLNHPNGSVGYRIQYRGRSICYLTDVEHDDGPHDVALTAFAQGADIMIFDASYTDAEYAERRGWGHSTWRKGAQIADEAGVDRFVVFHHDPGHDDDCMDAIAREVEAVRPGGAIVARQGMTLRA